VIARQLCGATDLLDAMAGVGDMVVDAVCEGKESPVTDCGAVKQI
jgi:hypothetical protein